MSKKFETYLSANRGNFVPCVWLGAQVKSSRTSVGSCCFWLLEADPTLSAHLVYTPGQLLLLIFLFLHFTGSRRWKISQQQEVHNSMDFTAKLWASTGHSSCLIDCNGKYVGTLLIEIRRSWEKNGGHWVKLLPEKKSRKNWKGQSEKTCN